MRWDLCTANRRYAQVEVAADLRSCVEVERSQEVQAVPAWTERQVVGLDLDLDREVEDAEGNCIDNVVSE